MFLIFIVCCTTRASKYIKNILFYSHNSGDNNSLDENAISEISPTNTKPGNNLRKQGISPSHLGSEKIYTNNMKNGTRRPAPKHPNYGGTNIPPAKLIAPTIGNNKPLKNGGHILDSDDASSGLLSHDSIDTKRQNDLNKCNAVYSYEQIPKLITPPHITNLETSEL